MTACGKEISYLFSRYPECPVVIVSIIILRVEKFTLRPQNMMAFFLYLIMYRDCFPTHNYQSDLGKGGVMFSCRPKLKLLEVPFRLPSNTHMTMES